MKKLGLIFIVISLASCVLNKPHEHVKIIDEGSNISLQKASFLSLKNSYGIILNIQKDHMDYFKTMINLYNSFQNFANNTNKNGVLVINADNEYSMRIKSKCKKVNRQKKKSAVFK